MDPSEKKPDLVDEDFQKRPRLKSAGGGRSLSASQLKRFQLTVGEIVLNRLL